MAKKKNAPKKKGGNAGQQKAAQAKKAKAAVDKTFGMKNKNKSKKVQAHIAQVQKQASQMQMSNEDRKKKQQREAEKEAKRLAAQRKREAEALMYGNVVIKQKPVPPGVDPKSIVCEFFKAKKCKKGNRCKFSHDLAVGRKAAKRNLYVDEREKERKEKEKDTIDQWDEDKLNSVVNSKQSHENRNLPTKIVCKYFLDAIEKQKYGWFWECPNGGKKCQYRHALPPGYVLKSERLKKKEEADKGPTLEALIEIERQKIGEGTPITIETFTAWKRRKLRDEAREKAEKAEQRKKAVNDGSVKMSGREAFSFDPSLFQDDENAVDDDLPEFSSDEETSDNTADTHQDDNDDDDDENVKVWSENDFKLADLNEDDPEGDELNAVAYAQLIAKRLGLSMQKRKLPSKDGEDFEEQDAYAPPPEEPASSTATTTATITTAAPATTTTTTASSTTTTTSSSTTTQTEDADKQDDKTNSESAAPINTAVFAQGDVDDLPDDFSDEE